MILEMKKLSFRILMAISIIAVATSCTSSSNNTKNPELTFVASLSGIDGKGYGEALYTAVQAWVGRQENLKAVYNMPNNIGEAEKIYADWQKNTAGKNNSVIVMAGSDYLDLVKNKTGKLEPNQSVLIIEDKLGQKFPDGVSSFYINRDGASFLMGCISSFYDEPLILAALENETILQEYIAAFKAGLEYASGNTKTARVEYLANGYEGFNMPEKAYEIAKENNNTFIYPLIGKSILGVFDVLKECKDSDNIVSVGLDMDCNDVNRRVVASMILNLDKVFDIYLGSWVKGEKMPVYERYGMEDGFVDIKFNENYTPVNGITIDDYKAVKSKYMNEALSFEKE